MHMNDAHEFPCHQLIAVHALVFVFVEAMAGVQTTIVTSIEAMCYLWFESKMHVLTLVPSGKCKAKNTPLATAQAHIVIITIIILIYYDSLTAGWIMIKLKL